MINQKSHKAGRALAVAVLAASTIAACGGSSSSSDTTALIQKNAALPGRTATVFVSSMNCASMSGPCAMDTQTREGSKPIYYSQTQFKCGTTMARYCNFLATAYPDWGNLIHSEIKRDIPTTQCVIPSNGIDVQCPFSQSAPALGKTGLGTVGAGLSNTLQFSSLALTVQPIAIRIAYQYYIPSINVSRQLYWLPTLDELTLMCNIANGSPAVTDKCLGGNLGTDYNPGWYWSSTVDPTKPGEQVWAVNFATGERALKARTELLNIRPIRTFLSQLPPNVTTSTVVRTTTTLAPTTTTSTTTTTTLAPTTTAAPTCATGGTCKNGDAGPGGGTIIYANPAGFACGVNMDKTCKYLEIAPQTWQATAATGCTGTVGVTMTCTWPTNPSGGRPTTVSTFGAGAKNTAAMYAFSPTGAAAVVKAYNGGGKTDWFIPSFAEANELCKWAHSFADPQRADDTTAACSFSFAKTVFYAKKPLMTSTDSSATNAWGYNMNKTTVILSTTQETDKNSGFMVWPMRAF